MAISDGTIQVLHVDDDLDFADLTGTFLERINEQFEILTTNSSDDALDILAEHDVECIVSDYDLPQSNGLEFLQTVRETHPALPFILFTGKGSEEVASDAISAGVTDYFQKESGTDQYTVLANRIQNYVERRHAETERENMRERMELALEYSDSILFEIDLQTQTVSRLGNFTEFFDRDPEVAPTIEDYASTVVHPADRADFTDFYYELTNGDRESGVIEYRTNPDSGDVRWVRDNVHVTDETPSRALGLAQDITERKESETRHEQVIARVTDAIVTVDENWRFTTVNDQAEALYGMSESELIGKDLWEVFSEARGTRFEEEYRQVMETREPTSFVEQYSGLDGWFDIEAYPSDNGGVAFYFVEITEQREREQKLAERTTQLEGVLDSVDAAIWIRDPDHRFELMNQNYRDLFDIPADRDIVGKRPDDLFDEETAAIFRENDQHVLDRQEPVELQRELTTDQGPKTFLVRITPLFDDAGEIESMCGVATDITERKEYERELQSKTRRLEAILENTTTPMFMKADNGKYIFVNHAYRELFDLQDQEIVGQTDHDIHPTEMADDARFKDQRVIERGEPLETEEQIIIDGTERTFLTTKVPIYDIGDRSDPDSPIALFGVASDISALKTRERELQRERDRLDEFASVVSHDLRNPLRVAEGSLQLAIEEDDWGALDDVADALDRMATLIEDLLALATTGSTVGEIEAVDIGALAEICWQTVETASATIAIDADSSIRADETRLQQLLENLLRNAIEHGGENIAIRVGDLPDGFYVADDGPGIPPDERDRIFEAGYSTRDDGTGFGLNIVREIAEAHDWKTSVTASSSGGACFEFTGVDVC